VDTDHLPPAGSMQPPVVGAMCLLPLNRGRLTATAMLVALRGKRPGSEQLTRYSVCVSRPVVGFTVDDATSVATLGVFQPRRARGHRLHPVSFSVAITHTIRVVLHSSAVDKKIVRLRANRT
jgi:hypothetical protein